MFVRERVDAHVAVEPGKTCLVAYSQLRIRE